MARKTPPKEQIEQPGNPTVPSVSEQLGTDSPEEQARLVQAYRTAANMRPAVVSVYYDPRVGVIDVQPIGGDMPIVMIQEVLILAQQKLLRDIEQAQQTQKTAPHE